MRRYLFLLSAVGFFTQTQFASAECLRLTDGNHDYVWVGDSVTIENESCQTSEKQAENGISTDSIIKCQGMNPIAVTFHQGEMYSFDMVSKKETKLEEACNE